MIDELPAEFARRYGPWALVVGGSDGIGAACARRAAAAGLNVALLARRPEPLATLADELRAAHGVHVRTIEQDLCEPKLVSAVDARTRDLEIGLLLCITGSSTHFAHFLDEERDDVLGLVQRNVVATVALAHHFGQAMRPRGRGGMLFCTSMAGFSGTAYQAVYSATKAFNQMLGESLWHDLHPHGIDALCLAIGATRTESAERLGLGFDDTNSMSADEVALEGLAALGRRPLQVAGEANRGLLGFLQSSDRAAVVEAMSQATASLAGLPHVERAMPEDA